MNNVDEIIMSLSEIADQPTEDGMVDGVCQQTIRDAVDLINYQHAHVEAFMQDQKEKIKPVLNDRQYEDRPLHYARYSFCPSCHQTLSWLYNRKYCGICGQAVKWNETD